MLVRPPPLVTLAVACLIALAALYVLPKRPLWTDASARSPFFRVSYSASSHKRICDPHDLPGTFVLPDNFDSVEGALDTFWQPIDETDACKPHHHIKKIARGELSDLPKQMFNRTIMVIGDSVDRSNVEYTCRILGGKHTVVMPDTQYWPQPIISASRPSSDGWQPNEYSARSFPGLCHIESIDLMLINVFHFGLDEENYFTWKDQYGPPYKAEDRIADIAVPFANRVGRRIDVLEFASGLWDLARFGRIDDGLLSASGKDEDVTLRHLVPDRIRWLSSRYRHLLQVVRDAFPKVPQILARKLHIPADDSADTFQVWWQVPGGGKDGNKHTFYFPSWRCNEVNMAIEAALRTPRNRDWQLDTWGDKLYGMEIYEPGNVHPHYSATSIWLEAMLYRLVNGP